VLIGGSQKAVMIPPGLAYLAVSERAWKRMETTKNPRYYFDLRKERKVAAKGESAYTPGVALIAALGAAFDYIAAQSDGDLAKGRVLLVENAETCAAMMRAAVPAMGMRLFAPDAPAAAVTAVMPPEGVDSGIIVKQLKARFGTIVANGQGEMKGQLFRVAHLGFFDPLDTLAVIGALEQVTADSLPPSKFQLGDALAAAQRVFAERSRIVDKAASTTSSTTSAIAEAAAVGR
jgi:aspartate aminotransferase-like enzyme